MSSAPDISTHVNALELTKYTSNPTASTTAQVDKRYIAVVDGKLMFWDGEVWNEVWNETSLKVATVNLTSAQIKALRETPYALVAAPGAGKVNIVESITLQLNYGGTNVFTESADNFVVQYGDSGTDITAAIENTGFIDQSADTVAVIRPATIAAMAAATAGVNEVVELFNTGDGEIGGNAANDNTLNVTVAYRTVEMV